MVADAAAWGCGGYLPSANAVRGNDSKGRGGNWLDQSHGGHLSRWESALVIESWSAHGKPYQQGALAGKGGLDR